MGGAIKRPPALRLPPPYWPSKRGENSADPADDGAESRMTRTIKLLASISKTNAGCFTSGRYWGTEAKP